jgi:DNA repair exonuclease SbcCD ATPase subunit
MKLRALRVRNVGPFGEQGCALEGLSDGLNVIRERNEAGKSTLFSALQFVLFEKHSSSKTALKEFRHDLGSGAPFIELDLEIDGRTYRIAKQYLSAATAVVTDAATGERLSEKRDAENWITRVIGSDKPDDGPSGMLWIRQGESFLQPNPQGGAGEALFSILEGEVDTVMGGQRTARVLERAETRLAEIVSTKQITPKGPFKEALSRLEALSEERAEHVAAIRRSESDREKLVNVVVEFRRLTEEDDGKLAQDLIEARKELEDAKGASEKIRSLKSEASALEEYLKSTESELSRFYDDMDRAEKLRKKVADLHSGAARTQEDIDAGEKSLAEILEKADIATAAHKQAKTIHREALARDKRRQDAQRRKSLEKALERARELAGQLKAAEKTAVAELPDLSALEEANQSILIFDAEARAGRPTLTVEKSSAPVLINGEAIDDDRQVRLSGRSVLDYQDLKLSIETPDAWGSESKLTKAKQTLIALLEPCGAADIGAARRLHESRNAGRDAVKRLKNDLKDVAPEGLASLEAALAALPAAEEALPEAVDLEHLSREVEIADEAVARIDGERDASRDGLTGQRRELAVLETQIEGFKSQLNELEEALGDDAERRERNSKLNEDVVAARRRWREAQDRVDEAERDRPSLEGAQARVKRLETAQRNRSGDRMRLSKEEGELRGRLAQAGQEGAADKLAAVEAEVARWRDRVSLFEAERDALVLLVEELSKARASRRSKFFTPVRHAVDPLLSMVLGAASLAYDDHLGPEELERNGAREKLTRLSGGTREQIAVLTRLGFAQVMAGKGRHIPIVLDDALVYSDDERIQKLFDAINVVATNVQIIAFSCRQKTFEALGGCAVHPTDFPAR